MQIGKLVLNVSAALAFTIFAMLPTGNPSHAAPNHSLTAKDVDGMMTTDPNVCPEARRIKVISCVDRNERRRKVVILNGAAPFAISDGGVRCIG